MLPWNISSIFFTDTIHDLGNGERAIQITHDIEKNDIQAGENGNIISDALTILSNMTHEPNSTTPCNTQKGMFHRM